MADRKVYVEVTLRLILRVNDGVDVSEILDDMDFTPVNERKAEADIEDTEVLDYEIKDSK